jgi:pyruvate/2-oxoglutarate dehydrogenase complex dihydrolipoamide acyltransferase (E2) component
LLTGVFPNWSVAVQVGSPMGGIVEKVEAKAGQAVKAGDLLCVISAMKMEVSRQLSPLLRVTQTADSFRQILLTHYYRSRSLPPATVSYPPLPSPASVSNSRAAPLYASSNRNFTDVTF